MARRGPQKRRERTQSRGARGQQKKQHTAPRPRVPGAGNQRKPETTGVRNEKEKKNGAQSGSVKNSETQKGGGGGSNHQGAASGPARTTKEARVQEEPRSWRPTKQKAHDAKAQGTWGRKPEKVRDNGGARGKKNTSQAGRRKEKQGAKARGTRGRKLKKESDKMGARKTGQQEEKKKGRGGKGN